MLSMRPGPTAVINHFRRGTPRFRFRLRSLCGNGMAGATECRLTPWPLLSRTAVWRRGSTTPTTWLPERQSASPQATFSRGHTKAGTYRLMLMEGTGGYDCPETFSLGKLRFVGERSWPLCQAHNLAEALFWNICLACQRNSAYKLLREGDSPLAAGKAFFAKARAE